MAHVERITPVVKLSLKFHCESQVYVIIVMHTYLWAELYQLQTGTAAAPNNREI